jgi:hypothetical protein
MNPQLENALARGPVTVTLLTRIKDGDAEVTRPWEYPLAYPMQAVILYKEETAKLDRARAAKKLASGGVKLTREEKRALRKDRRALLQEARDLFDSGRQTDAWPAEVSQEFDSLLGEANAITCALDEDAGTGDSLYIRGNWQKIDDDFDRLLLALWVGTHQFYIAPGIPQVYREQISMSALQAMEAPQIEEIAATVKNALSRSLVARRDPDDEEPVPNALAPEATTPATATGIEMETNATMMADTETHPLDAIPSLTPTI